MSETSSDAFDLGAWLGRKQAFSGIAGRCSAADAICIRTIRDEKKYKAIGLTWDEFCKQRMGMSRSYADRMIQCLNEFGESYFHLAGLVPIAVEDYRLIAGHVNGEEVQVEGGAIRIDPQNAAALAGAVADLRHQARLALPAPEVSKPDNVRKPRNPKKPKQPESDPRWQAIGRLETAVGWLDTLLADASAMPDRTLLMTAVGGSLQRLSRIDRRLRG